MEKVKTSKKALRELINKSIIEAVSKLDLPKPSKRIEKIVNRNAKKLAVAFTHIIKREDKKKQKVEASLTQIENVLAGKKKKKKKVVKVKAEA